MLIKNSPKKPFNLKNQLDILIVITPKISPECPTVGPALLKSYILEAGFSCEISDFNIELYNYLKETDEHDRLYFKDDALFQLDTFEVKTLFCDFYNKHQRIFNRWMEFIREKNPKHIGLSLLTPYSQAVAYQLSLLIRKNFPTMKIVWGGPNIKTVGLHFQNQGLIDYYISGDGEKRIVKLLKGEDDLNSPALPKEKNNLENLLHPNYDDINWDLYKPDFAPNPVYITGSRGCVRSCSFCDVAEIWPQYIYRPTKDIANEIRFLIKKHNRRTFYFTDSLINGSLSHYRELLVELVQIKNEIPDFGWFGQWILRPERHSPEPDYLLLKQSGCLYIDIGLESFSESIRKHMGKNFSNQDVNYCFSMLKKYNIRASILMIVGYPTETDEDHQMTLDCIWQLYNEKFLYDFETDSGVLTLCFTNTLILDFNSKLWQMVKNDVTKFVNEYDWDYKENTLEVRIRRLNEINDLVKSLTTQKLFWQIERKIKEQNDALTNIKRL